MAWLKLFKRVLYIYNYWATRHAIISSSYHTHKARLTTLVRIEIEGPHTTVVLLKKVRYPIFSLLRFMLLHNEYLVR
jgi:hypothetical protein